MTQAAQRLAYTFVGWREAFAEATIARVRVGGEAIGVVQFRERFFAFNNLCPHRGAPMHFGYVTEADEVVCPFHFAVFALASGQALDGPYGIVDLEMYEVRVEGDAVLIGTPA